MSSKEELDDLHREEEELEITPLIQLLARLVTLHSTLHELTVVIQDNPEACIEAAHLIDELVFRLSHRIKLMGDSRN